MSELPVNQIDEWHGAYRGGWKGRIVPDAFAHPAKVSFSLAKRIYAHILEEGWAGPNSIVIDPFGGIAGSTIPVQIVALMVGIVLDFTPIIWFRSARINNYEMLSIME